MSDRISVLKPGRVFFARVCLLAGVATVIRATISGAIVKEDGVVMYSLKGYDYRLPLERLFNTADEAFADEVK